MGKEHTQGFKQRATTKPTGQWKNEKIALHK